MVGRRKSAEDLDLHTHMQEHAFASGEAQYLTDLLLAHQLAPVAVQQSPHLCSAFIEVWRWQSRGQAECWGWTNSHIWSLRTDRYATKATCMLSPNALRSAQTVCRRRLCVRVLGHGADLAATADPSAIRRPAWADCPAATIIAKWKCNCLWLRMASRMVHACVLGSVGQARDGD